MVYHYTLIYLPCCRVAIAESCRSFKELFVEIRERASKALGFAKMLRKVCVVCIRVQSSLYIYRTWR